MASLDVYRLERYWRLGIEVMGLQEQGVIRAEGAEGIRTS